ncbi:hypothetical protein RDI58_022864 [Solanum bulbocastanum]
MIRH